jgi:hypothetical protein
MFQRRDDGALYFATARRKVVIVIGGSIYRFMVDVGPLSIAWSKT